MMESRSSFGLTSVFWPLVCILAAAPAALAEHAEEPAARIAEICLSRGNDGEACACLSREAGSRFEPDQLQIIVEAMEAGETASDVRAALLLHGASEADAASFAHRLDTAQVVIHQTCGASLFEPAQD